MVIGCTKKLLDFLSVKPTKPTTETDPLFTWTANLIILNRRKTLVAVNNATKCCFVLHGLTAKSIAKMPELIKDGIRAVLQSEYIASDVIDKYIADCGENLTFTTTASRSDVAYCNKACERVERFVNLFESESTFQEKYLPWINDDMIAKDDYSFIYENLITALTEKYGAPVQSVHVAELEVTLDLLTTCKRTLVVPSDLNFYQLHKILQNAFEWHDCHLHQFILKKDSMGRPREIIQPAHFENDDWIAFSGGKSIDSTTVTVREIFESQKKIDYEYDFGDGWIHTVKLKRFIPNCNTPYPHCTEAIGDAPMEDSGGPYGFDEKMKILNDPDHPDHEWISDWVQSAWWHPLDFDSINRKIKQEHRQCIPVQYDLSN